MSNNPPKAQDLKALQKIWYQKLKESGFDDIEDTSSKREYLKNWESTYFYRRYDPMSFEMKQEYYRQANLFLNEYKFEWIRGSSIINWMEKEIWRLHADGSSIRDIELALGLNRNKVHLIIKKLVAIMKKFMREYDV